jgi:hypothetical protein
VSSGNGLTRVERWDARLKSVFDEIDRELESVDGLRHVPLHPVRPPAGSTSNPEDDGVLELGANYTVGIGSKYGPGYVLRIRVATLEEVDPEGYKMLEDTVVELLRQKLPAAFPGANLSVDRDGSVYKIHGDLSLDGI